MKRFFLITIACGFLSVARAQADDIAKTHSFKVENLFTGGDLNLGYYSGVTQLGLSPQLGYSVTQWLDAGIVLGFTYTSQHDNYGNTLRQTLFGPGAFARLFPIDFLFASVQFEHNFLRQKYIPASGELPDILSVGANSLLLGLGYASGKQGINSPYYYFSVSIDVLDNPYSPYRDVVPGPNGGYVVNDIIPVIKAGVNIPLFQGGRKL